MKILASCAHRHLVFLRSCCLQNSLAPLLWKRGHQVLRSFQSPTLLQQGGSRTPSLRGVQPRWLSSVDVSQCDPKPQSSSENSEKFTVIYHFPAIRLLKLISRLKVLQTGLAVLLLPPVWYVHGINQVTWVTGLFSFTLAFLYAISFFLQRVIGFMYLNESGTLLKISHLTFWGKRRNFCCPVQSVVTLDEEGWRSNRFLLKFRPCDQKEVLECLLRVPPVKECRRAAPRERAFSVGAPAVVAPSARPPPREEEEDSDEEPLPGPSLPPVIPNLPSPLVQQPDVEDPLPGPSALLPASPPRPQLESDLSDEGEVGWIDPVRRRQESKRRQLRGRRQ